MKKKVKGEGWLTGLSRYMNDKEIVIKWNLTPLHVTLFKILSTELIDDDNYSEHYYNLFFIENNYGNNRLKCRGA